MTSLQDDLIADLQQAPGRPTAAPTTAPAEQVAASAPVVELRITPRAWSAVGWTRRPDGDGVTIDLGPVRLSLAGLRH